MRKKKKVEWERIAGKLFFLFRKRAMIVGRIKERERGRSGREKLFMRVAGGNK